MNRTRIIVPAVLATAFAVVAGQAALAQPASPDLQATQAELTTEQATTIAEAMGKGRATRVKLERDGSQAVYKVKVRSDDAGTVKLKIAAAGGRVLSTEREEDN